MIILYLQVRKTIYYDHVLLYITNTERVTAKFACFSVVYYGHRKDTVEIVFISY